MNKQTYLPQIMELGAKLEDARKSQNISIEQAALETGLSIRDIRNIELTEDLYPIHHLFIYINFLGYSEFLLVS
ncbi:MAG: hypothetical protein BWY27_01111 [Bacteroidetes bacterium ADurb.Bin234]|nr:MAG: hypothetical protein BWY27_01111 [Bacteroidetes bacterium ADurb.Bin234]